MTPRPPSRLVARKASRTQPTFSARGGASPAHTPPSQRPWAARTSGRAPAAALLGQTPSWGDSPPRGRSAPDVIVRRAPQGCPGGGVLLGLGLGVLARPGAGQVVEERRRRPVGRGADAGH